jgi:cytoskeleton protein RodZ
MAKVTRLTLDSSGGLERRRLHLREISDDADAPLETVGQDLRKARQRKGEDLALISAILKIRKDHLEALEESDFDALPGRTYTIGFVRSYAGYLGLDAPLCVERLKAEIAGRSEVKEGTVQVSTPRERKLPPGGMVFAVLLLIALVYGAYYLIASVNRMATQAVTPVPPQLAAQAGLPANPAPAAPPPPAAQATQAPETAATPVSASAEPAAVPAPLPPGIRYGAQNNSRITLLAHKPARVTVLGPDRKLFLDRNLQAGDSYLVPNAVGLTLSTSDAGAVEMILDGSPIGYAGKDGDTAQGLSLNPQDIVERRAR